MQKQASCGYLRSPKQQHRISPGLRTHTRAWADGTAFLGGSFLCNLVLTQLSALQPLTVLSSSTAHGEPLTVIGAGCQVSACARLGWDGASRFPVTGQQVGSPALSQAKEVKTRLSRAHLGSVQSTASRTWALAAPHPGPDSGTEGSPPQSRLPWGVDREVSHRLSTLISS